MLRRHPDAKRRLRAVYYRINGRPTEEDIPDWCEPRCARYEEPNARLAQQLTEAGIALPGWLSPSDSDRSGVATGE